MSGEHYGVAKYGVAARVAPTVASRPQIDVGPGRLGGRSDA